jgi:hypothetical protein
VLLVVTGVASLPVAAPGSDRCEYSRATGALRRHRGVVPAQAPRFRQRHLRVQKAELALMHVAGPDQGWEGLGRHLRGKARDNAKNRL